MPRLLLRFFPLFCKFALALLVHDLQGHLDDAVFEVHVEIVVAVLDAVGNVKVQESRTCVLTCELDLVIGDIRAWCTDRGEELEFTRTIASDFITESLFLYQEIPNVENQNPARFRKTEPGSSSSAIGHSLDELLRIAAWSFAMSSGESCGRSISMVSLSSLAVSGNGGL